jgi:phosphoglucosamine mutase
MGSLFGTDGVRGVANRYPMTPEMALKIGRATVMTCARPKDRRLRIVVGNDTRRSAPMLESALAAGLCSSGADVFLAGTLPTPAIAFLARDMGMDAGIMVSASHNPFEDNGIKIFSGQGFKLPDAQEDEIERLVLFTEGTATAAPTGPAVGTIHPVPDAPARYEEFCKGTFPDDLNLHGMKLVLDCANGAAFRVAPAVFESLGADVTAIHCRPDGTNINDRCGSQHTESLALKVRETGADAGLAFDGDGDRLIAVDELGRELSGDHIMAVCGHMYRDRGWLTNNLIVVTVMSNFGFRTALERAGIDYEVAAVGDRYVMELMQSAGAIMGGEASGHIIFRNHHSSGDGIISGLQLLSAMRFRNRSLSRLSEIVTMYPQVIVNVDVSRKPPLASIPEVQAAIGEAERELAKEGRVLVRYSGTQDMCRVMVEAREEETAQRLAHSLAETIRKFVG